MTLLGMMSFVNFLQPFVKTSRTRVQFVSSWHCVDDCCGQTSQNNRSCVLRNVCVFDGELVSVGRRDLHEPFPTWYGCDRTNQVEAHPVLTLKHLDTRVDAQTFGYLSGTTMFVEYAHFNIVHTMLDMVYPVFVSMLKLGLSTEPGEPLRILHRLPHGDNSQSWFLHLIGDLGVEHIEKMDPTCFETLVVGGGNQGLLSWDSKYAIPGARDGALKAYRNMIYSKANVSIAKSMFGTAEHANVLFLNQHKRPVQNIQHVSDHIKDVVPHAHVQITDWESIVSIEDLQGSQWREHQVQHFREIADFREKLRVLKTTNVLIAGVGTSHLFEFLLLDGSVSINYGTCENYDGIGTFYDDYLIPGIDWVRGLYYVNKTKCKKSSGIELPRHSTQCLMKLAMQTVQNPLEPINIEENLSPFGKSISIVAQLYPKAWRSLRSPQCKMTDVASILLHNTTGRCLRYIPHEVISALRSEFLSAGLQYPCV